MGKGDLNGGEGRRIKVFAWSLSLGLKVYVPWPKSLLVARKKKIMFIAIAENRQRLSTP